MLVFITLIEFLTLRIHLPILHCKVNWTDSGLLTLNKCYHYYYHLSNMSLWDVFMPYSSITFVYHFSTCIHVTHSVQFTTSARCTQTITTKSFACNVLHDTTIEMMLMIIVMTGHFPETIIERTWTLTSYCDHIVNIHHIVVDNVAFTQQSRWARGANYPLLSPQTNSTPCTSLSLSSSFSLSLSLSLSLSAL